LPRSSRSLLFLIYLASILPLLSSEPIPLDQAKTRFQKAEKTQSGSPKDPEAAWKLGQACFDLAEFSTTKDERADLAQKGIEVCRQSLTLKTNSAPAHYYLALNLGQLARTRSVGALKLVPQMEQELLTAEQLDPLLDHAGPDRSLGLLYRDAPTLISIGSRAKSRDHLRRAVELVPDYPENRLCLIDSCLKWGDRAGAHRELEAFEQVLPKARETFNGPPWVYAWNDWDEELRTLQKKIEESSQLKSPRH
jgi:tetratricopeptide (TPR) repeat protein